MLFAVCFILLIETGFGHFQVSHMIKNMQRSLLAASSGYFWHTAAHNNAHETPPKNPSLLEYKCRCFAQCLIARRVKRKESTFGTRRRMESVTRHPFSDNFDLSSILFIIASVDKSKPGKTTESDNCAKTKSIGTVEKLKFMIGTKAARTQTSSVTSGCSRKISPRTSKKSSSRRMLRGPIQSVSISAPGLCTPSLKLPKV
mmetsp:Transcript_14458/g.22739  ORF Transcript_14458/g.22739 Transcript_14458/m.22739 type:complete len:201 (+) Transcript_14458:417-1019(+)